EAGYCYDARERANSTRKGALRAPSGLATPPDHKIQHRKAPYLFERTPRRYVQIAAGDVSTSASADRLTVSEYSCRRASPVLMTSRRLLMIAVIRLQSAGARHFSTHHQF